MGNMHIITGFRNQKHITAADVGSFQAAVFGDGNYVLDRGSKFSTITVSNNLIRVSDGDILMQGRHVRLNEGTHVDLTIDNGQNGYQRNDLIVARYTKDSNSGVEDVTLAVIKGTPAASNPVDPEYTDGDIINDHVYLAEFPLYRIPINNLVVGALAPLFTVADSIAAIKDLVDESSKNTVSVVLNAANWASSQQTVNVSGVTSTKDIIVAPAPASFESWGNAGVRAIEQGNGTVTFKCSDTPTENITAQIMIWG